MTRHWSSVLCALCVLGGWAGSGGGVGVEGLTCTGLGACGCAWDDGSGTVDVSSIGNTDGTPRFRDIDGQDGYLYSYNPCQPFTEGTCSGAALCQVKNSTQTYQQIGDAKSVKWISGEQAYMRLQAEAADRADTAWALWLTELQGGLNVTAYYEHIEQAPTYSLRESFVTFVCDPMAVTPRLNASGGDGTQVFYFTVTTHCACPNGCVAGSSGATSLSAGSVLLVVFFVSLFVYVAGGMVINRSRHQSTGLDLVPHIHFWRALPGIVKDGCLWVTCQFRRQTYSDVS